VTRLRSKLAIVPQDAVLLPGTVRDNLDPSKKYSDDVLWEALEKVQLRKTVECFGLGKFFTRNSYFFPDRFYRVVCRYQDGACLLRELVFSKMLTKLPEVEK